MILPAMSQGSGVRSSDYPLALALLSVSGLPWLNDFLQLFVLGSANTVIEMNREFDYCSVADFWTLLCGAGSFLAASGFGLAHLRRRSRPFGVAVMFLALIVGLFTIVQALLLDHPLTRSVQGRPLDPWAYWTQGGGWLVAAMTTLPLLMVSLLLRGWEELRRRASRRATPA